MQSTRLPGKVLLPTPDDRTLLAVMLERVKRAGIPLIIVASTWDGEDEAICTEARKCGIRSYVGHKDDVLLRVWRAASRNGIDTVVRLTADCPLVDPAVIAYCVETFGKYDYDYVGTSDRFPDGMDVDVLSLDVLRKSLASPLQSDHEHVTLWAERNAKCLFVEPEEVGGEDWGDVRLTIDELTDYRVITQLLHQIGPNATMREYVECYKEYGYHRINGGVTRNAGLAKSLAAEATA